MHAVLKTLLWPAYVLLTLAARYRYELGRARGEHCERVRVGLWSDSAYYVAGMPPVRTYRTFQEWIVPAKSHPEQRAGEIFLGHVNPEAASACCWKTYRIGSVAWNTRNSPVRSRARPLFVAASELEAARISVSENQVSSPRQGDADEASVRLRLCSTCKPGFHRPCDNARPSWTTLA